MIVYVDAFAVLLQRAKLLTHYGRHKKHYVENNQTKNQSIKCKIKSSYLSIPETVKMSTDFPSRVVEVVKGKQSLTVSMCEVHDGDADDESDCKGEIHDIQVKETEFVYTLNRSWYGDIVPCSVYSYL